MSASSTDATWLFVPDALRAAAGESFLSALADLVGGGVVGTGLAEAIGLPLAALSADEKSFGGAEARGTMAPLPVPMPPP